MVRALRRHGLLRVSVFTMLGNMLLLNMWLFLLTIICIGIFDMLLLNFILWQWLDSTVVAIPSQSGGNDPSAWLRHSALPDCSYLSGMGCNRTDTPGDETKEKVHMQNYTPSHYTHQQSSSFVATYQNNFNTQSTVRNPYIKTRVIGAHPMIRNPYLKTPRTNECHPQVTSISKPKELFQGSPWNLVSKKFPKHCKKTIHFIHTFLHIDICDIIQILGEQGKHTKANMWWK